MPNWCSEDELRDTPNEADIARMEEERRRREPRVELPERCKQCNGLAEEVGSLKANGLCRRCSRRA